MNVFDGSGALTITAFAEDEIRQIRQPQTAPSRLDFFMMTLLKFLYSSLTVCCCWLVIGRLLLLWLFVVDRDQYELIADKRDLCTSWRTGGAFAGK
jgi:hypothetical protein